MSESKLAVSPSQRPKRVIERESEEFMKIQQVPISSAQKQHGVQFGSNMELPMYERTRETARSNVTTPLISEDISGISEEDLQRIHVPRLGRNWLEERLGNKYAKRHCKKEDELKEINYGIDFSLLKQSVDQQKRLREFLKLNQNELHHFVEQGSAPVFGYPPICYSPPGEENQQQKGAKNYLSILMRHVFTQNNALASVGDLIDAQEAEEELQDKIQQRFTIGRKAILELQQQLNQQQSNLKAVSSMEKGQMLANNASLAKHTVASNDSSTFKVRAANSGNLSELAGQINNASFKSNTNIHSDEKSLAKVISNNVAQIEGENTPSVFDRKRSSKGSKERPDSRQKKKKGPQNFITNISIQRSRVNKSTSRSLSRSRQRNTELMEQRPQRIFLKRDKTQPIEKAATTRYKIRPQTSSQGKTARRNVAIGRCRFTEVAPQTFDTRVQSDHTLEMLPQLQQTQTIPDTVPVEQNWIPQQAFSKKQSQRSINTASTKPNSAMHFNQNGIHTTQFGRYPIDSAGFSHSSKTMLNTVRQSRSNAAPIATLSGGPLSDQNSMPISIKNTTSVRHRLVPSELMLTANERNSKLQLQNFKINQELRKNMEKSIIRQRRALKQSIQSYVPSLQPPRVTLKRTLTDFIPRRAKGSRGSNSLRNKRLSAGGSEVNSRPTVDNFSEQQNYL